MADRLGARQNVPVAETFPEPAVGKRLTAAFAAEEASLRAALDRARVDFNHRGVRGEAVERAVRLFLQRHLPRKFAVGTGEAIDRFGHRTAQLDVLVLNDEQPFVHELDESGLYLVEGVSAVGEVKTRLSRTDLEDILNKGERLRALAPTHTTGDIVRTNPSDRSRFVESVPYFGLALESHMSIELTLEVLNSKYSVTPASRPTLPTLDALFVLGVGSYYNFWDGQGSHQFRGPEGFGTGWIGPFPDNVLVGLFSWLNGTMSRITRANSIATPYLMATNLEPTAPGRTSAH